MKLIDILVKELPKRGGWPDGGSCISQGKGGYVCVWKFNDVEFYDGWSHQSGSGLLHYWCHYLSMQESIDYSTAIITREQYEAALSKSITQRQSVAEWVDELPPVGCIVRLHGIRETTHLQFQHSEHCQANLWRNGDEVEVISVKGKDLAVVWHEESKTACGVLVKFLLPLKTEADKKRDEAIDNFVRELILCVDLNAPMVDGSSKVASKLYELLPTLPGVKVDIK